MHGQCKQDKRKSSAPQVRERVLDLYAQGVTRRETAERAGVPYNAVKTIVLKAQAENDPRATPRQGRPQPGYLYGVPHDLVGPFKVAAAKRGIDTNQLRRRILAAVIRDNLFDALDLDDPAFASLSIKGKRQ